MLPRNSSAGSFSSMWLNMQACVILCVCVSEVRMNQASRVTFDPQLGEMGSVEGT